MPNDHLITTAVNSGSYNMNLRIAYEIANTVGISREELDAVLLACDSSDEILTIAGIKERIKIRTRQLSCDVVGAIIELQTLCLSSSLLVNYASIPPAVDGDLVNCINRTKIFEIMKLPVFQLMRDARSDNYVGLLKKRVTNTLHHYTSDSMTAYIAGIHFGTSATAHHNDSFYITQGRRDGTYPTTASVTLCPYGVVIMLVKHWKFIERHFSTELEEAIERPLVLCKLMYCVMLYKLNTFQELDEHTVIINQENYPRLSTLTFAVKGQRDVVKRLEHLFNFSNNSFDQIMSSAIGKATLLAFTNEVHAIADSLTTQILETKEAE